MKLAVFYPESIYSAWSCSGGLANTFRRMGNDVIKCPINPHGRTMRRSEFPALDDLRACDAIVLSGMEHFHKHLLALYPDWQKLSVLKLGWFHETQEREDYGQLPLDEIKRTYDIGFTPAAQDEKYGLAWLPFGVDTEVFRPSDVPPCFDAGFVGLLYGPRQEFLKKTGLAEILRFAKVDATGSGGKPDVEWSARLLAESYRSFKLFVNLPSLCQHVVTKVYEVMACGVALLTPIPETSAEGIMRNFAWFTGGHSLLYYVDNPKPIIDEVLADDALRISLAQDGLAEIRRNHRLEKRCEVLLSHVSAGVAA